MKWWTPTPIWSGRDVYVVGGGASLEGFPWEVLRGKPTIACNAAFLLGVGVCPIMVFGDSSFWPKFREALEKYNKEGGMVVSLSNSFRNPSNPAPEWVLRVRKVHSGLAKNALGWNCNTGASAINLALLLGARRVLLLGFDMKGIGKRTHFHNAYTKKMQPESFIKFKAGMTQVAHDLPKVFPGREVLNLTDDSALDAFPKHSLRAHLEVLRSPVLKEAV